MSAALRRVYTGQQENYEEIPVILGQAGFLVLRVAADDDPIPVSSNSHVTRTIEEDHRSGVFVDSSFVRNFFYVDIEDRANGEIDGLGVYNVAFEEKFDSTAVFGNAQYDPSSVFDRVNLIAAK